MAREGKNKWYAAGLAFECQQSGNCCGGAPGYVWVNKVEIAAIAKHLGLGDEWLPKKYLRRVGLRYSLTERNGGDCIFLERSEGSGAGGSNGETGCTGCRIHQVKPTQCGTWPFWGTNLKTPDYWNEAAKGCPGINRGPMHSLVQIDEIRFRKAPS